MKRQQWLVVPYEILQYWTSETTSWPVARCIISCPGHSSRRAFQDTLKRMRYPSRSPLKVREGDASTHPFWMQDAGSSKSNRSRLSTSSKLPELNDDRLIGRSIRRRHRVPNGPLNQKGASWIPALSSLTGELRVERPAGSPTRIRYFSVPHQAMEEAVLGAAVHVSRM